MRFGTKARSHNAHLSLSWQSKFVQAAAAPGHRALLHLDLDLIRLHLSKIQLALTDYLILHLLPVCAAFKYQPRTVHSSSPETAIIACGRQPCANSFTPTHYKQTWAVHDPIQRGSFMNV